MKWLRRAPCIPVTFQRQILSVQDMVLSRSPLWRPSQVWGIKSVSTGIVPSPVNSKWLTWWLLHSNKLCISTRKNVTTIVFCGWRNEERMKKFSIDKLLARLLVLACTIHDVILQNLSATVPEDVYRNSPHFSTYVRTGCFFSKIQ